MSKFFAWLYRLTHSHWALKWYGILRKRKQPATYLLWGDELGGNQSIFASTDNWAEAPTMPIGKSAFSVDGVHWIRPEQCHYCGKPAEEGDIWRWELTGGVVKQGHTNCFFQARARRSRSRSNSTDRKKELMKGSDICMCGDYRSQHDEHGRCRVCTQTAYDHCDEFKLGRPANGVEQMHWDKYHERQPKVPLEPK